MTIIKPRCVGFAILAMAVVVMGCASSVWAAPLQGTAQPVSFHLQIRPIFQARCYGCHQPSKPSSKYVMTLWDRLLAGGESETTAIVPGAPDKSNLIEMIAPADGEAEMPKDAEPLDEKEIALIRAWIEQGAKNDSPASAVRTFDREHPPVYHRAPAITSVDFSPDDRFLAVAGFHEVLLFDVHGFGANGFGLVDRFIGLSERITSVRFSPDGQKLAVTGGRPGRMGEVQIWDIPSRTLEVSWPVTYDTVYGASWSDDGRFVAFGGSDNSLRMIDVESGEQVLHLVAHKDWVLGTVFSRDGSHIISAGRDGTAKLTQISAPRLLHDVAKSTGTLADGGLQAIVRHPTRDEVLVAGADGVLRMYLVFPAAADRAQQDQIEPLWSLPRLPGRVFSLDISSDGRRIIAGTSLDGSGMVHLFAMNPNITTTIEIRTILSKPVGDRTGDEKKRLAEHFATAATRLAEIPIPCGVFAVAFDANNRRAVAAGGDGVVRLIDVEDGRVAEEFTPAPFTRAPADAGAGLAKRARPKPAKSDETLSAPLDALPAGAKVVALEIMPESIHLNRATDYVQLVVTARLDSGDSVDVTRLAELSVSSDVAIASRQGVVRPMVDGNAVLTASLSGRTAAVEVETSGTERSLEPDYLHDVSPIIARLGCNTGKCHGSRAGKNGFKLSLRGYDPHFDIRSLSDDLASRRIERSSPDDSLMLLKPTATVPHGGGQPLKPGSDYYETLRAWIANGAVVDYASGGVARLEVYPENPVVQRVGDRQQVRVVAVYDDGQTRDVTAESFIESASPDVARQVKGHAGLMEVSHRGEATVLVRYEGKYGGTTITIMGDRTGFVWRQPPANNTIDELVWAKLKRTKTLPSDLCDDYEFVRRTFLDLVGLPPSPQQIHDFTNDTRPARLKREDLIDRLIGSPDYIEHWANKWADLLQVNSRYLGKEGAAGLRQWIREQVANNTPYDEFAREILAASGSTKDHPAASYFKILRTPQAIMENTTHLFLSVRFKCNECHDHPFERWTQDDHYQLAAYFARVGLKKDPASGDRKIVTSSAETAWPLYEIVFDRTEGEVIHLRTHRTATPKFPFECNYDADPEATRREQLAAWITSPDNPYFARGYVNRLWGYLTGRGLIEPLDDIRAGNPPTNPELLDWLTARFVESGFDIQDLVRTICRSRTYQLSTSTNRWNEDDELNYSHARARRLPAEVMYDAIHQATGAKSKFPGVPAGTRAAALPDVGIRLPDGFLTLMGRPARESPCECERSEELQLGTIMAMVNSPTVGSAIGDPENAIARLARDVTDDRELVEELFLRVLDRPASEEEVAAALESFARVDNRHDELVSKLADLERALAPMIAEEKRQRLQSLSRAEEALERYRTVTAPILAEQRRKWEQRLAKSEADLDEYEETLPARLLAWEKAQQSATVWVPLDPLFLDADMGTKLARQPDLSVLASGPRGKGAYRILAATNLQGITGVRIDALADEKLPGGGPGRRHGDFVLTELEVAASSNDLGTPPVLKTWDFATGAKGWRSIEKSSLSLDSGRLILVGDSRSAAMEAEVVVPAGPIVLEMIAKVNLHVRARVSWQTLEAGTDDKSNSVVHTIAAGAAPWRRYRFVFAAEKDIASIRLDFDRLSANLEIDSIRLLRAKPEFSHVVLKNAQADFSAKRYDVSYAIDGKARVNLGWAILPEYGQNHAAVFETVEDWEGEGGSQLRVALHQYHSAGENTLGKFRISVTHSPRPLSLGHPRSVAEVLQIPSAERSDSGQNRLESYYRSWDREEIKLKRALAEAKRPLPPDQGLVDREKRVKQLKQPLPVDPRLERLRQAVGLSKQQLANRRLTTAQDLTWALINSPEFLYNH